MDLAARSNEAKTRCSCRLLPFVFLSGLHWHLSGLSELLLERRLLLLLAGEAFSIFYIICLKMNILVPKFCFCEHFFSMYGRFDHFGWGSTTNTVRQGAISPHKAAKRYVPTRARLRKQADRVRANVSSNIYSARCGLKTKEDIEIFPARV